MSSRSLTVSRIRVPVSFELNGTVAACLIELRARAIHQDRWPAEAELIRWTGAVQPDTQGQDRHVSVASTAMMILRSLNREPCFIEVSASGLGTAQALGYQMALDGNSLEAGLLLVLVGSGGGPQPDSRAVYTGAIDAGLVGIVGELDLKIDAAREEGDAWRFIGPRFSGDAILANLAPEYHDRVVRSRAGAVRTMDIIEVVNIDELCRAALSPWSLVRAAQEGDYYYPDPAWISDGGQDPVTKAIQFIREGNSQRFRALLAELLREGEWRGASELLASHVAMHLRLGRYADGLGEVYSGIRRSLTDIERRRLRPPLAYPLAMALAALAKGPQQHDALILLEAVHGRSPIALPRQRRRRSRKAIRAEAARVVAQVCQEISDAHLQEIIDGPLNLAREKFQIPFSMAPSHAAFQDVITALYMAIGQDTGLVPVWADGGLNTAEALKLLDESFADIGGSDAAEAMARHGAGMHPVAERLVEHLRQKLRATRKFGVLKELCDPLDPGMQVECVRALMAQLDGVLPKDLPPSEFLVDRLDVLLRRFVEVRDRMTQVLRGL